MDWIGEHLQIIIAIAGAIAYWLNARKKEKSGEAADYDGDGEPDTYPQQGGLLREEDDTLKQEENMRRIQEEIRRARAEREGGGVPAPTYQPAPPPMPLPSRPVKRWEQDDAYRRAEARRIETERQSAEVLERQQALAAQLAALSQKRAEAGREAKAVWTRPKEAAGAGAKVSDHKLLAELRNARSLRKAIVLREVLGPPLALR